MIEQFFEIKNINKIVSLLDEVNEISETSLKNKLTNDEFNIFVRFYDVILNRYYWDY